MFVELQHPNGGKTRVPGNPIKLSVDSDESMTPPPLLGADTTDVLAEWAALPANRIAAGIAAGVLQQGECSN